MTGTIYIVILFVQVMFPKDIRQSRFMYFLIRFVVIHKAYVGVCHLTTKALICMFVYRGHREVGR